jgi:hypothetical protein
MRFPLDQDIYASIDRFLVFGNCHTRTGGKLSRVLCSDIMGSKLSKENAEEVRT